MHEVSVSLKWQLSGNTCAKRALWISLGWVLWIGTVTNLTPAGAQPGVPGPGVPAIPGGWGVAEQKRVPLNVRILKADGTPLLNAPVKVCFSNEGGAFTLGDMQTSETGMILINQELHFGPYSIYVQAPGIGVGLLRNRNVQGSYLPGAPLDLQLRPGGVLKVITREAPSQSHNGEGLPSPNPNPTNQTTNLPVGGAQISLMWMIESTKGSLSQAEGLQDNPISSNFPPTSPASQFAIALRNR